MQVNGQNIQTPQQQSGCTTNPQSCATPPATSPVQTCPQPQMVYYPPQNVQVPACSSGVNIQIFNPTVAAGNAPVQNNPPCPQQTCGPTCYPSGYYTGTVGPDGKFVPNNTQNTNPAPNTSSNNTNNGTNNGTIGDNNSTTTINNNMTDNNPQAADNTQNQSETASSTDDKKKTEKRKIVQLTDDYIKSLENSLNSQDKAIRVNAAKEVFARLEEDDSRHDDKALTALINKMLQDPAEEIRVIALSALDSRIVTGDNYTVNVLKNMQTKDNGYGQDAVDAASILLKMAGKQVEKEFEVKNEPKKEKTETKKE